MHLLHESPGVAQFQLLLSLEVLEQVFEWMMSPARQWTLHDHDRAEAVQVCLDEMRPGHKRSLLNVLEGIDGDERVRPPRAEKYYY